VTKNDEKQQDDSTRNRLLLSAGEVFALHGFHRATIQTICEKAEANIAAVNYYFGSKENLYLETLKFGRRLSRHLMPEDVDHLVSGDPQVALRSFVRTALESLLDDTRPQWYFRMLSLEQFEPSPALERYIHDVIEPWRNRLSAVIELLGERKLSPGELNLVVSSIAGQCQFYLRCRAVVLKMRGASCYGGADIEEIADHITTFSLGGIRAIMQRSGPSSAERTAQTPQSSL
jgi:AcrR family transcriptional regulator